MSRARSMLSPLANGRAPEGFIRDMHLTLESVERKIRSKVLEVAQLRNTREELGRVLAELKTNTNTKM